MGSMVTRASGTIGHATMLMASADLGQHRVGQGSLFVTTRSAVERQKPTAAGILCLALTAPEQLTPKAVAVVTSSLDRRQPEKTIFIGLGALAGLLYARPDLVRPSIITSLATLMSGPASTRLAQAGADAWHLLAMSPVARPAMRALTDLLGRRVEPKVRRALLAVLPAYARWRPDALDLEAVLRAARTAQSRAARDLILREVIEPLIFTSPRAFTRGTIDRVLTTFSDRTRLRYTLGHLVSRPGLPPDVRAHASRWLRRRLPHANAQQRLGENPRVLVIHNIADGQGDEIIRVVPLLQSLLDARPTLTATVLTRRAYLYDHPRVTPSLIEDDRGVDRVLAASWDGIVDFNAKTVPGVSTRPELVSPLNDHLASHPPSLRISAMMRPQHFTFKTVRLGGRSLERPLRLDRTDIKNAYDATERLLIELGLPVRSGNDTPRGGSLLVGTRSREAEAHWARLRPRGDRPTALVNSLGGAHPLKGFTREKAARLAAEISGLVDEGYAVILLPNGQAWGRAETLVATLGHLGPRRRQYVRMAPDPAAPAEVPDLAMRERPEVHGADRVMRLFKYFASYADLVVTVEGWLVHLTYALGRPFRLFMAPASPLDWLPLGRGARQRLVTAMSRFAASDAEDLLREIDPPPQPPYARKLMLMAAARGLGDIADESSAQLLLRLFGSPDPEVRAVAVEALAGGDVTPIMRGRLRETLGDEAAPVRAAAARALLRSSAAGQASIDSADRRRLLADVAIARQDWATVWRLGTAALPALAATSRDPNPVIQREAGWVTARIMRELAPALFSRSPS